MMRNLKIHSIIITLLRDGTYVLEEMQNGNNTNSPVS